MRQIVIISGKGGTGKTIITAAFAALARNKVMADCDVDAADLHLLLKPKIKEKYLFKSGFTAKINKKLCQKCGKCIAVCRFQAISDDFSVDAVSCEGCSFCKFICPAGAIRMEQNESGHWYISDTRFGPLVHARLGIAEENSGKLVSLVREKAKKLAEEKKCDWVIVDGAPGIGCPVIASLSGVDFALVVTEPTLSGLHDADRVINVARHFKIDVKLVINKFDLNRQISAKIEKYCSDNKVDILGKVSFDKSVVQALVQGETIIEYPDGKAKEQIKKIWQKIKQEQK